ncbi:13598_t:CDS:2, partial [Entrophospora sp. SA101]
NKGKELDKKSKIFYKSILDFFETSTNWSYTNFREYASNKNPASSYTESFVNMIYSRCLENGLQNNKIDSYTFLKLLDQSRSQYLEHTKSRDMIKKVM